MAELSLYEFGFSGIVTINVLPCRCDRWCLGPKHWRFNRQGGSESTSCWSFW